MPQNVHFRTLLFLIFLVCCQARAVVTDTSSMLRNYQNFLSSPQRELSEEAAALIQDQDLFLVSGNSKGDCHLSNDVNKRCLGAAEAFVQQEFNQTLSNEQEMYSPDPGDLDNPNDEGTIYRASVELERRLIQYHKNNGTKKIILVTHSMGGPIAWTLMLRKPQLMKSIVQAVVNVNGAMCGSLSDPDIPSLTTDNLKKYYEIAFEIGVKSFTSAAHAKKSYEVLNRNTFFVRMKRSHLNPLSDYVILLNHQSPEACEPAPILEVSAPHGISFEPLEGNHCSIFCPMGADAADGHKFEYVQAFWKALLTTLTE